MLKNFIKQLLNNNNNNNNSDNNNNNNNNNNSKVHLSCVSIFYCIL